MGNNAVYAENDYSYLDDMSINQLKALDDEIHKRLPSENDEQINSSDINIVGKWIKSNTGLSIVTIEESGIGHFDYIQFGKTVSKNHLVTNFSWNMDGCQTAHCGRC